MKKLAFPKPSGITRVFRTLWEFLKMPCILPVQNDLAETEKMAGTGFELVVVFRGKSYILSAAGDKLGIISAKERR